MKAERLTDEFDHGEKRCRLRFTGSHVIKLFQPTLINSDLAACLSIWVILPVQKESFYVSVTH